MRLSPLAALLVLLGGATAAAQDGARPGNPSFNLFNRTAQSIEHLFATPVGVDRWGQDRLQRFSLPPGMGFPVRLPADGNCVYDLQVIYADGSKDERRRVNTCQTDTVAFGRNAAGPGARTGQAATDDPSFRLVNRSRAEVNEVYASPSGNDDWGRDRLGDDTVRANGTYVVRLPPGDCTYDVRVVFANKEIVERRQLNLCRITDLKVP